MGVLNLAVLVCVLRAATVKSRKLFEEKSAPPDKFLAMPMLSGAFSGARMWNDLVEGHSS